MSSLYPNLADVALASTPVRYPNLIDAAAAPAPMPPCSLCGYPIEINNVETAVLSCQHRAHATCSVAWSHKHRIAILGGRPHCRACPIEDDDGGDDDAAAAAAAAAAAKQEKPASDQRRTFETCVNELRRAYRRQFPDVDLEQIMAAEVGDKDMLALLGPLEPTAGYFGVVRALMGQTPVGAPKEDDRRAELLALRGDELVDEMLRRKRDLNLLFDKKHLSIAHLYRVGIDSMAALERLGFDCNVHLSIHYYVHLPPYFLALHYNLTYQLHLAAMTADTLVMMQPKKQELVALAIDAGVILNDLKLDSNHMLRLGIAPSELHDYAGVTHEQFLALEPPLTTETFKKNEAWRADRRRSPFTSSLYDALRSRTPAK